MREIADIHPDISFKTTEKVLSDLLKYGYIKKMGKQRDRIHKKTQAMRDQKKTNRLNEDLRVFLAKNEGEETYGRYRKFAKFRSS